MNHTEVPAKKTSHEKSNYYAPIEKEYPDFEIFINRGLPKESARAKMKFPEAKGAVIPFPAESSRKEKMQTFEGFWRSYSKKDDVPSFDVLFKSSAFDDIEGVAMLKHRGI